MSVFSTMSMMLGEASLNIADVADASSEQEHFKGALNPSCPALFTRHTHTHKLQSVEQEGERYAAAASRWQK